MARAGNTWVLAPGWPDLCQYTRSEELVVLRKKRKLPGSGGEPNVSGKIFNKIV